MDLTREERIGLAQDCYTQFYPDDAPVLENEQIMDKLGEVLEEAHDATRQDSELSQAVTDFIDYVACRTVHIFNEP